MNLNNILKNNRNYYGKLSTQLMKDLSMLSKKDGIKSKQDLKKKSCILCRLIINKKPIHFEDIRFRFFLLHSLLNLPMNKESTNFLQDHINILNHYMHSQMYALHMLHNNLCIKHNYLMNPHRTILTDYNN